ncbi:MAG: hypothetical protein RIQ81_312 [Pseudomonadota bacterium]|jgi:hypothetical protein
MIGKGSNGASTLPRSMCPNKLAYFHQSGKKTLRRTATNGMPVLGVNLSMIHQDHIAAIYRWFFVRLNRLK